MVSLRDSIQRLFTPIQTLPAGIYHYQAPPEDPRNYRLHLRLEPDGSGVLIVNAATVLHLNPTAAEYAYHLVQGESAEKAAVSVASRYRVNRAQARQDYDDFVDRIDTLVSIPDLDPVSFLDFDRQAPFSGEITAPYRLDLALTYRFPEFIDHRAAPTERVKQELSTDEWRQVLNIAWQVGIPHVIFTGGEPTLREDLLELIAVAEKNGQVTGLLTDGFKLADQNYLEKLLETGLDHLLILLYPDEEKSWIAIKNAAAEDIYVSVHLTLTRENADSIPAWLVQLAELKIRGVSLTTADPELSEKLRSLRDQAASSNLDLIWDLPVPYSDQNPVALEVESTHLHEGAGRAWLYVEPDGDVLPAQGINHVLGNLLNDPWEKIWKNE